MDEVDWAPAGWYRGVRRGSLLPQPALVCCVRGLPERVYSELGFVLWLDSCCLCASKRCSYLARAMLCTPHQPLRIHGLVGSLLLRFKPRWISGNGFPEAGWNKQHAGGRHEVYIPQPHVRDRTLTT